MKTSRVTKKAIALMLIIVTMPAMFIHAFAAYDTPTFSDVPKNYWGYTYIEQAAEKKWVGGMGGGIFQPGGPVTYAQFATMLCRAFFAEDLDAYDGPTNQWFLKPCSVADQNGLFNDTKVAGRAADDIMRQ